MRSWTCIDEPVKHGAFPQSGLEEIAAKYGIGEVKVPLHLSGHAGTKDYEKQAARIARGEVAMRRFCCPVCQSKGAPGWVRSATQEEIARMVERVGKEAA